MQLFFQLDTYLEWFRSCRNLPSPIYLTESLHWQGLTGVSLTASGENLSLIHTLRSQTPLKINLTTNAIPEQVRIVMEGKPHSVTIWNDKKENGCYDPRLFAQQLQDSVAPLKMENVILRLYAEPLPEIVKESHRLGIDNVILVDGDDALLKSINMARKLNMGIWTTRLVDWEKARLLRSRNHVDGVLLNDILLQFIIQEGVHGALNALRRLLRG